MRMFARIGSILALALAVCGMSFAGATERLVGYSIAAFNDYGDGMAKLQVDLAYNADAKPGHAGTVDNSLVRDGNGLRQYSAMELTLSSPDAIALT